MALLHEEGDHNHKDKKKKQGTEDRYSSEPEKAYPTGELIIFAKFGGHVLHHLGFRLVNVIRQGGWEGGRLKPRLAIFKKNLYLTFYNCCTVLCTISGFSNVIAV